MPGGNDVDYTRVYQRVANAADVPLSDAPQGGGVNESDSQQNLLATIKTSTYHKIRHKAVTDSGQD